MSVWINNLYLPDESNISQSLTGDSHLLTNKEAKGMTLMRILGKQNWFGETGRRYSFRITKKDSQIPKGGGVYIFVKRRFFFWAKPLYVGKAANFRNRLIGHERWTEASTKRGATERHIFKCDNRAKQGRIEENLIRHLKPPMNKVHVPRNRKDAPNDKRLKRNWRPEKKPFFGLIG